MNDETALKELLSMSRIYRTRGQHDKAEECMQLARQIQARIGQESGRPSERSLQASAAGSYHSVRTH